MSSEDNGPAEKDESSQANKNEELPSSSRIVDEPNTTEELKQEEESFQANENEELPSSSRIVDEPNTTEELKQGEGTIKRRSKRSKKKKKRKKLDSDEENLLRNEPEEANPSELQESFQEEGEEEEEEEGENKQPDSIELDGAIITPVDTEQMAEIEERVENAETVPEESNVEDGLPEEERNENMEIASEKLNVKDGLPEEERDENAEIIPEESNVNDKLPEGEGNENVEAAPATEDPNVKNGLPEEVRSENMETVPKELTVKEVLPKKATSAVKGKKERAHKPRKKRKKRRKSSSDSDDESSTRPKKKKTPGKPSFKTVSKAALTTVHLSSPTNKVEAKMALKKEEPSEPVVNNTVPRFLLILDGIIIVLAITLFVIKPTCEIVEGSGMHEENIDGDLSEMNETLSAQSPINKPPPVKQIWPDGNLAPNIKEDSGKYPSGAYLPDPSLLPYPSDSASGSRPTSESINDPMPDINEDQSKLPSWGYVDPPLPPYPSDPGSDSNTDSSDNPEQSTYVDHSTSTNPPDSNSDNPSEGNDDLIQVPSVGVGVIPPSNTEMSSINQSPATSIPTVLDLLTPGPTPSTSQSSVAVTEAPSSNTEIPTIGPSPTTPTLVPPPSSTVATTTPAPTLPPIDLTLTPEDIIPASSQEYVCGKRGTDILDPNASSNRASEYSWPWTVRLRKLSYVAFPICGAVIVSPRHAVSACRCIQDRENLAEELKNYRVSIGLRGFDSQRAYHISKMRFHPACNVDQNVYDLLLLTLQQEVKFNHEIQPVCLPQYEQIQTAAKKCWVSGWSKNYKGHHRSNAMKQHYVEIVPEQECQNRLRDKAEVGSLTSFRKEIAICAENTKLDSGCSKESGGSLTCEENGKWIMYGVTSWSFNCEVHALSEFFAAVSFSLSWLCCFMQNIQGCKDVSCDAEKYRNAFV